MQDWFDAPSEINAAGVSEGKLLFLIDQPKRPAHHHHNEVTIGATSLRDGWVALA
jgi:hypothetical protein